MGYDLDFFVENIDQEFICSICMTVLKDPVESPCEHVFCAECIKGLIRFEFAARCPVDLQRLSLADLKPSPRYFRNMIEKLEVRCEMKSFGCREIIAIQHLENHLSSCIYNPDAVVVCDKGCNLSMTRRDYQENCYKHSEKRFTLEMAELSEYFRRELESSKNIIQRQQGEMRKLQDEVNRQLQLVKLDREQERLCSKSIIQRQQKEIRKLQFEVTRSQQLIAKLFDESNTPPEGVWKTIRKMKCSDDNIMEPLGGMFTWSFAQLSSPLTQQNSFFEIRVLEISEDQYVMLGLTPNGHQIDELPGLNVGTICFCSKGEIYANGTSKVDFPKWKNDDIIECGIMYPYNFSKENFPNVEVYFSFNRKIISKTVMKIKNDGLFPTIRMGTFINSVPKVKYLSK